MLTENANVIFPCVHFNGTPKSRLIENLCEVRQKLNETYEALKQAGPNGRDYYPVPGLMDKAIEQHRQRQLALDSLLASIDAEIDAIDKQGA